jgi:hypothetical protein
VTADLPLSIGLRITFSTVRSRWLRVVDALHGTSTAGHPAAFDLGADLEAFELARAVTRESGPATVPDGLWDVLSLPVSVTSDPAGGAVTIRPFGKAGEAIAIGVTPVTDVRVPRGVLHWRTELAGYRAADLITGTTDTLRFELSPENGPDREMIRVPRGDIRLWVIGGVKVNPSVTLEAF